MYCRPCAFKYKCMWHDGGLCAGVHPALHSSFWQLDVYIQDCPETRDAGAIAQARRESQQGRVSLGNER